MEKGCGGGEVFAGGGADRSLRGVGKRSENKTKPAEQSSFRDVVYIDQDDFCLLFWINEGESEGKPDGLGLVVFRRVEVDFSVSR